MRYVWVSASFDIVLADLILIAPVKIPCASEGPNPKLASSSAGPLIFHGLVRALHALLASSTRLKFYREHQMVLKTRCPRRLCLDMYGGNLKVCMVVAINAGTRK